MLPSNVRVFVCVEPVDLRRGFDTLVASAREKMRVDPLAGGLFIFAGRRRDRLKMVWLEGNRCCLLWMRLDKAVFKLPDGKGAAHVVMDSAALARLLAGVPRR